jgi:hypothetical protein
MNTALYPKNESTLWADLQKAQLGSYYEDFIPNYFEYKLWIHDVNQWFLWVLYLGEREEDCEADKKPEDDGGEKAPVLSS